MAYSHDGCVVLVVVLVDEITTVEVVIADVDASVEPVVEVVIMVGDVFAVAGSVVVTEWVEPVLVVMVVGGIIPVTTAIVAVEGGI